VGPNVDKPDILIVGAGVSGLSLSYFLKRRGLSVEVFESRPEPGGNIQTESHDGFTYDVGPDSFVRTKPDAEALCRELGLGDRLIEPLPEGRQVFVAFEGALHPMPEGLSLGVPTHPRALFESNLLSGVGKLRAICEPFVWRPEFPPEDESIQAFLRRRLGPEMAERVAAPLLSGVFAGDAARLSIRASFPQIPQFESQYGSLFWGMKASRRFDVSSFQAKLKLLISALFETPTAPPSPFFSLRGGMTDLISRLVEACSENDGTGRVKIHLASPVKRVLVGSGRTQGVVLKSGQEVRASRVVICGPPWAAAEIVGLGYPRLRQILLESRGAPTATVFFGLDRDRTEKQWQGSGFIVPPGEGKILASTFTHQKWPGRAPPGKALIRAFVGGARALGPSILSASDDELIQVSRHELERFLGGLGAPIFTRVYRYARGTPQPEVGHFRWVSRVRAELVKAPDLSLIGPGYDGVGIPDCIRAARELADFITLPERPVSVA
jgi:protoporphyrinogen/coproporphyrinogen III oxidase